MNSTVFVQLRRRDNINSCSPNLAGIFEVETACCTWTSSLPCPNSAIKLGLQGISSDSLASKDAAILADFDILSDIFVTDSSYSLAFNPVMAIRLRLAMHGRRHHRVFHLVAMDSHLRRDAKPAELLGVYDPHTKEDDARVIRWSIDRIRYWLSVGATPSKSVVKMLELGGILKPGSPYHTTVPRPPNSPPNPKPSGTTS